MSGDRRHDPVDPAVCKHPAARIYAWIAYDGTFCAGCCDCGAVLAGAATGLSEGAGDDQGDQVGAHGCASGKVG